MTTIRTVEDAYQMALKAEEKLSRKPGQQGRGRASQEENQLPKIGSRNPRMTGRNLRVKLKEVEPHSEASMLNSEGSSIMNSEGDTLMQTLFPRTRGRGRGRGGVITCFTCGNNGHKEVDCPDRKKDGGEAHIAEAQRRDVEVEDAEDGRSLMMRKVLLTPEKEVEDTAQRIRLFQNQLARPKTGNARLSWIVEAQIILFRPRW